MERKNSLRVPAPDPTHGDKETLTHLSANTARRKANADIQHQSPKRSAQAHVRPISRRRRRYATSGLILVLLCGLVMPIEGISRRSEPLSAGFLPTAYTVPHGMPIKTFAMKLYRSQGATAKQWTCLRILWTRESHWNYKAKNPNGGAYGIPQAYPASKLASAGSDWRTNPATQIRWGLKYLKHRYNSDACLALKKSKTRGWY